LRAVCLVRAILLRLKKGLNEEKAQFQWLYLRESGNQVELH
jgi:hypothetical protein